MDKISQIDQQILALQTERLRLLNEQEQLPDTQLSSARGDNRKVVIIGGKGQLGKLFTQLFLQSNYQVQVLEKDDWKDAKDIFAGASLVLVAVPIHLTNQIIAQLNQLPQHCVLADVTSIKVSPLQAMLDIHQGPVVGLHPMFGPGVNEVKGQTIIVCHGRCKSAYQWVVDQLVEWQANIQTVTAEKHDQVMAFVQVLRHFSTVVYGAHLATEQVSLDEILAMSSPIYRLELAMVGRLFAQQPELYTEIIFANPQNIAMMQRYLKMFEQMLDMLKTNDKDAFHQTFQNTRDWFAEYADQFLQESNLMLTGAYANNHLAR